MGYHKQGQLSQHFNRSEFACKCGCGFNTVDAELICCLEFIRDGLPGSRIVITSGCRCSEHNAKVGGSPNSQHLRGKAADFIVTGYHEDDVANFIELWWKDRYGVGRYNGRTHLDVRDGKSRWDLRK
jgi:uncharacterized protein YcbK (DUF882 family)